MRQRKLREKIYHLREAARTRKLTPGERAILSFSEDYVKLQEYAARAGELEDEVESEDEANALVCSNSECGEDEHEDDARFCKACGSRLKSVDDERADETEGRVAGRDDVNDLRGDDHQYRMGKPITHSAKADTEEAVRTFARGYARALERI